MPRLRSLLCCAWLACRGVAAADDTIETQEQFDAWLARDAGGSPLDALTPGARERFIVSLSFGPGGIASFDASDLMDELSDAEIRAVMALFGPRALDSAPPSHYLETQRVEKNAPSRDVIGPIEKRYNRFYAQMRQVREATDLVRADHLARQFDSLLADLVVAKELRRVDDHELRLLRAAARRVALGTLEPRHVEAFREVFRARVRRALVSSDDAATLYNLALALRRHSEARRLRLDYPLAQLPPVPPFVDAVPDGNTRPTVWRPDAQATKLTRQPVDLAGTRLVVTVSCNTSRELVAALSNDSRLAPVLKQALWLTLSPGIEEIAAVRDWNRDFPGLPVAMVYDRAEWRMLPDWRATQFHVVRDGQELESLEVRDDAQSTDALLDVLGKSGLLDRDNRP